MISSDKLARILQKMLAVGNVMNEGTYRGQAAGFTLDSLLKMVHTKGDLPSCISYICFDFLNRFIYFAGIDKKTSVLDYVVKRILSKGDERLLEVADDISLADTASRLSGHELAKELQSLVNTVRGLEEELQRVSHEENPSNYLGKNITDKSDGVTAEMTSSYMAELELFIKNTVGRTKEIVRVRELMTRKVTEVVEYFGEDASTCDTTNIFEVLVEFRRALVVSKENAQKKSKSSIGVTALSPAGNSSLTGSNNNANSGGKKVPLPRKPHIV